MTITAEAVRQLRERTGAGMMECKRALVETRGDLDAAAELMRRNGLAKADKKAARIAAEGTLVIERSGQQAVLVEVNCETDFVARGDDFQAFARDVGRAALASQGTSLESLMEQKDPAGNGTLEQRRRELVARIGENISVRRFERMNSAGPLGAYLHGTRIGALVAIEGGDDVLAKDLAMHVAAINPAWLDAAAVPAEVLAREREVLGEQAKNEKKPPEIIARMVEGRLRKFLAEIPLTGQPFVKDPDTSVEALLKRSGARAVRFVRFEVGAGIDRKQDDFVGEVMAQVKGSGSGG